MTEFRGIIYKARNIVNGKIYIGYSEKKLEERRNEHLILSKNPKYLFHKALQKHSYHNFHWEILDISARNIEELELLEIRYIKEFDSYAPNGKGYNMTRGGGGITQKGDNKENNPISAKISKLLSGRTRDTHAYIAETAEKKRGRTKETDIGVAKQAQKIKGRTKENNISVALGAEKKRGRTAETHIGLAKGAEKRRGRTKENDPGVASAALKLKGRSMETHSYLVIASEKRRGRTKETHAYLARSAEKQKGRTKETHPHLNEMAKKLIGRTKETHPYLIKASESKKTLFLGQNNPNSKTNKEKRRLEKLSLENTPFNLP